MNYIYIAIEKPYPFPKLLDIAGASKLKKKRVKLAISQFYG